MSNQKTMAEGGGGGETFNPSSHKTGRGVLGLCTLCQHVFEQFSEAKPLSIIRAFKWYFSGKIGIFSHRKCNNETILKGNDY